MTRLPGPAFNRETAPVEFLTGKAESKAILTQQLALRTRGVKQKQDDAEAHESKTPARSPNGHHFGLPTKAALLTAVCIMLTEALIFGPSIAGFRKNWLMARLAAARVAALAAEATPDNQIPEKLGAELLDRSLIHSLAIKRGDLRRPITKSGASSKAEARYNLETAGFFSLIADALHVFISPRDRLIDVTGRPEISDGRVEIVLTERPLL